MSRLERLSLEAYNALGCDPFSGDHRQVSKVFKFVNRSSKISSGLEKIHYLFLRKIEHSLKRFSRVPYRATQSRRLCENGGGNQPKLLVHRGIQNGAIQSDGRAISSDPRVFSRQMETEWKLRGTSLLHLRIFVEAFMKKLMDSRERSILLFTWCFIPLSLSFFLLLIRLCSNLKLENVAQVRFAHIISIPIHLGKNTNTNIRANIKSDTRRCSLGFSPCTLVKRVI